ncbi:MAG TPA: family 78 glycoside hydrolase catalytic domain, partial [Bacteroidales bacterium]|nr:family 78 glycoside hydrolase catalytic domain [Bacteroidales bacterium]
LADPEGTGKIPEFSWIPVSEERGAGQSACQVIIDTKPRVQENKCLWNSGKVSTADPYGFRYSGPALQPSTRYYWKVKLWDQDGKPSSWSKPSGFITGLFEAGDWSGAKWIGFEDIPDSLLLVPGIHGSGNNLDEQAKKRTVVPYFRKAFNAEKRIKQAFLHVSGLGQYEAYINGKKIGDRFLAPGWTDYDKECFYNTYDVTGLLQKGTNVIGALVGNGFYNINRERYRKLVIAYGAPKLIVKLKIRYSDGSVSAVVSDESWKTAPSPVTFTSIYGGEDYDAALEQKGWDKPGFNDNGWKNALAVKPPAGLLQPEQDHPLKVMEEFSKVRISHIHDSVYVYDFGQNASGIISLKVSGPKGMTVRLTPAELVGKDSLADQRASGSPYYFSYRLKGSGSESWIPRFSYYGFRYVQVNGAVPEGEPNPLKLPVISELKMLHTRNSSPQAGEFSCSNDLFNKIYNLIRWAIRSNMASVATDCPHREKLGWLEQTHLMGNSFKYVYDIHNLYNKMIDDMIGAQLENGLVPDIAPEYVEFLGGFRDSPEWGSACVIVPWDLYEWYGDVEAVRKAYPMMQKYISYLNILAPHGILIHGLGDWYDLGPEFPGVAQLTPKSLTATSIYYYDVSLMAKMASLLGQESDSYHYRDLAENIRFAFNKEFFNRDTKVYSTGSQTSYSMPLFFGMVEDSVRSEVVSNLVKSIRAGNNALTAGDVGYRYLLRVLEQEGQSQLIYEMNSRTDVPGYGYQLSKGATALTESWAGLTEVSNNHMMLGHLMEWFYSGPGGIRQADGSKAYDRIIISPEPVGDITWAVTSFNTVHGKIGCSWKIEGGKISLRTDIPVGCKATVMIPFSKKDFIDEGGKPITGLAYVSGVRSSGDKTILEIPSGHYTFTSQIIR